MADASARLQQRPRCSPAPRSLLGRFLGASRVAVCFFGLSRNLSTTLPSIEANLLGPLLDSGADFDIFVHAMLLNSITNKRSHEKALALQPFEFASLNPCRFTAEDQDTSDEALSPLVAKMEGRAAGFQGTYDHASKWNAVRAYYSLWKVSRLVLAHERSIFYRTESTTTSTHVAYQHQHGAHLYTHVVAARPDTSFLSPFDAAELLRDAALYHSVGPFIRLPSFRQWGGLNDRFAAGEARAMLHCYMSRYTEAARNPEHFFRKATNTERLLCLHLARCQIGRGGVSVEPTDVCVKRVRADGSVERLDRSQAGVLGSPKDNYPRCLQEAGARKNYSALLRFCGSDCKEARASFQPPPPIRLTDSRQLPGYPHKCGSSCAPPCKNATANATATAKAPHLKGGRSSRPLPARTPAAAVKKEGRGIVATMFG